MRTLPPLTCAWVLTASACGSSQGPHTSPLDGAGDATTDAPKDASVSHHRDAATDAPSPPLDGGHGSDAPASGRTFPDTFATIAILSDQLPTMTSAQIAFAASHYVGTQKQLLPVTTALRAKNPNFLVLHYHLAMWQTAPKNEFIVDGVSWGNDYPTVTMHNDWFWQNAMGQRVASSADGKLLMNVTVPGFESYWLDSLETQVADGQYDAIFFDSAAPSLLQGECSTADPRLAGTATKDTSFSELGNTTWIDAWQTWIAALSASLAAKGIPLIPNTGAFITGWDDTNYAITPGIFSEGFAGTGFAESDWQASTNQLLVLASKDKIMILQNYLSTASDVGTRLYYLANYLLVKGHHTYLDYFDSGGALEWYPEWALDLGAPTTAATTDVKTLLSGGAYRRDFAKGVVLVNPSTSPVTVALGKSYQLVTPTGGGPVDSSGNAGGSLSMSTVSNVTLSAASAAILLD